jgi:hypothetical protein
VPRLRRFRCRNTACRRQTFDEPLRDLVTPHAPARRRRQGRVAVAAGGEACARLLGRLRMAASPDALLRLLRQLPLPLTGSPRAIGVDDWALRRGAELRHDPGRSRAALRRRSSAGPHLGTARGVAARPARHPDHDPQPVDRVLASFAVGLPQDARRCAWHALEQPPARGSHHQAQAAVAGNVRPDQLPPSPPPRAARRLTTQVAGELADGDHFNFGCGQTILPDRERIKCQTIQQRRSIHQQHAAWPSKPEGPEPPSASRLHGHKAFDDGHSSGAPPSKHAPTPRPPSADTSTVSAILYNVSLRSTSQALPGSTGESHMAVLV